MEYNILDFKKENNYSFMQIGERKLNPKIKEVLEWVYCIIIAIILALLFRYFIGTPTIVKQESMYPTLEPNQRLWLNRWPRTTKHYQKEEK